MKTAVINKKETFTREEFAKKFIGAYDEALKIMQGKLPRRKTNWDEQFKEWDKWAKEAENG
ncbi:MAG: hypothetical protein FWF51_11330 [Chitinivibrionia bacterium]|nr:hypothetical protein [Chitinivibrionia bacterium]